MSSPEIPQPHDSLVRYTFGSPENAVSLFKAYLPPRIVEELDWEQIRLESGTYVDEDLRRSESDLLYSAPVREERDERTFVYLLFEHQSTADRFLPLRLLGYMVAIWKRQLKDNPAAEGLPPIVPLVLSQVEGGWRVSKQFADLLLLPKSLRAELERFQPRFEHSLIDLSDLSNDQLRGNLAVRLAQSLLKAVMEGKLLEWIDWATGLLRSVESGDFLRVLLLYAANAESQLNLQNLVTKIKSANIPQAAETIMSIAERIRVEGIARGELIGQIRTLRRILKRPENSRSEFDSLSDDQLQAMITELERQLP